MLYRRCLPDDLPAIVALQDANLAGGGSLSPQGFLSARLDAGQFLEIARDLAVIVATQDGEVAGYLCAAHNDAYADGLGMTVVGDFRFDGRSHWLLAFPVPLPPHC